MANFEAISFSKTCQDLVKRNRSMDRHSEFKRK